MNTGNKVLERIEPNDFQSTSHEIKGRFDPEHKDLFKSLKNTYKEDVEFVSTIVPDPSIDSSFSVFDSVITCIVYSVQRESNCVNNIIAVAHSTLHLVSNKDEWTWVCSDAFWDKLSKGEWIHQKLKGCKGKIRSLQKLENEHEKKQIQSGIILPNDSLGGIGNWYGSKQVCVWLGDGDSILHQVGFSTDDSGIFAVSSVFVPSYFNVFRTETELDFNQFPNKEGVIISLKKECINSIRWFWCTSKKKFEDEKPFGVKAIIGVTKVNSYNYNRMHESIQSNYSAVIGLIIGFIIGMFVYALYQKDRCK